MSTARHAQMMKALLQIIYQYKLEEFVKFYRVSEAYTSCTHSSCQGLCTSIEESRMDKFYEQIRNPHDGTARMRRIRFEYCRKCNNYVEHDEGGASSIYINTIYEAVKGMLGVNLSSVRFCQDPN